MLKMCSKGTGKTCIHAFCFIKSLDHSKKGEKNSGRVWISPQIVYCLTFSLNACPQCKWKDIHTHANQLANTYLTESTQWSSIIQSKSSSVVWFVLMYELSSQARPIQTQWMEPRALTSTGSPSCPLWRGTRWGRRSSRKWRKPGNLRPDNQPPPSRPAQGSKPWRLCQRRLSRIKPLRHLVHFSGWLWSHACPHWYYLPA